jgi:putative transposase
LGGVSEDGSGSVILTYKYRIKDRRAKRILNARAVAVNQVWNYCCAYQRDIEARYRLGARPRQWPSRFDLCKLTAGTSRDLGISADTINSVCFRFFYARNKARRSPKFRASFGPRRSLGWIPTAKGTLRINGNSATYYGETFRWFGSKRRPLPDRVGAATFVEDALGRWWVSFNIEAEQRQQAVGPAVGIDLGLKTFATASNGAKIEAPRIYREYEHRLSIAQRAGNRQRTRRLHTKIANCRRDFLHKASTDLVRSHSLIAVGNVSASQLAKTRMAKSVLDAGWSAFRSMLSYKCQQAGAAFLEIDEKWTSVTCSECGALSGPQGQKGLRIREWICPDCGASHARDTNAARNILARSAPRPVGESQMSRIGTEGNAPMNPDYRTVRDEIPNQGASERMAAAARED